MSLCEALRHEDFFVGTDVEFGPQDGRPMRAAVIQFATSTFVVIIPLQILTRTALSKPKEQHAVLVRPACALPFTYSALYEKEGSFCSARC